MSHPASRRRYKEISLQQLRSFCATARLGSLAAAAAALGLAQPTVWEQVHALERTLGTKLLQRQVRGSQLTATGRLLAELAAPLVAGADSLQRSLQEAEGRREVRLCIAGTERTLAEDLPAVVREFQRRCPHIRLRLLEVMVDRIAAVVESGEADLGVLPGVESGPPGAWLQCEPAYELDLLLVTPADHPLARQRVVRPRDLLGYPLVNTDSPLAIPDRAISSALQKLGVFQTQPRQVEAAYSSAIRSYVALGCGIGLVVGLPKRPPPAGLHQRSLSRYFGRVTQSLVRRKTAAPHEATLLFAETLRTVLARPRTTRRKGRGE